MEATALAITNDVFTFYGQAHLDTFALDIDDVTVEVDRHDGVAVNSLRLSLEAIRKRTNEFAFWQHRRHTGRPAYAKRSHAETVFSMISALLDHRLRCRSRNGRKNEIRVKLALFNLIQLARGKELWSC